ncbi:type II toxin-antitoxin system RnlB family antitoxin [Leptolyngbya sp. AN03gr2]|uniref:type II toxin-antitoxin system RnlB family antitoxin n=1 Tax=unclassified Leptolyngbya TaxID=2650499 RepID=UPI003D320A52
MVEPSKLFDLQVIGTTVLVIAKSYESPINYLALVEQVLSERAFQGETVVFDSLTHNGFADNRYVQGKIEQNVCNRKSLTVIPESMIDPKILAAAKQFYQSHPSLLQNSVVLENNSAEIVALLAD